MLQQAPSPRKVEAEADSRRELVQAIGRLIRGLSALFWGLPLALVIYVQSGHTDWLDVMGGFAVVPSLAVTALLWFGISEMNTFQKQVGPGWNAIRKP